MHFSCRGCLFWNQTGMDAYGGYEGECRRYPPEGSGDEREWPPTNGSDWCGEFFDRVDDTLDEDLD